MQTLAIALALVGSVAATGGPAAAVASPATDDMTHNIIVASPATGDVVYDVVVASTGRSA